MSEVLKPCPFCGADAELELGSDHHGDWFNLGCSRHWDHQRNPDHTNTCIAGRILYTETDVPQAEAIAAWNTRTASAPVATEAMVERVAEAIHASATGLDSIPLERIWGACADSTKDNFRRHARAALAAMGGADAE